jgi:hypothetical protein
MQKKKEIRSNHKTYRLGVFLQINGGCPVRSTQVNDVIGIRGVDVSINTHFGPAFLTICAKRFINEFCLDICVIFNHSVITIGRIFPKKLGIVRVGTT